MNVFTNQLNTGLPVRNDNGTYLNAAGIFDLSSLVNVISDTSDLQGASIPADPFADKPYCWEDWSLLASVILKVQLTQRDDIEEDPTLPPAVVSDVFDNMHTFILAARKFYGKPTIEMSQMLEYEGAKVKVLRRLRGLHREKMGEFIHSQIACFSNVALSFKAKNKAFDKKFPALADSDSDSDSDSDDDSDDELPPAG